MKRLITLSVACLLAMPFYAQIEAEGYSVKETYSYSEGESKPATPSSTQYNLFDSNNNLYLELSSSAVINTYDANGLKTKSQTYSSDFNTGEYMPGSYTEYFYDENKQLIKTVSYNANGEVSGYVEYENYINGMYQDMKSINKDGVTITYWRSSDHVFENGTLIYTVNSFRPSADVKTRLDSTVYIYNNGICTGMNQYQFDNNTGTYVADPVMTETYTYTDGKLTNIRSVSSSRWGVYVNEEDYKYSSLSASYVPQNLSVKENASIKNVLDITWSAPQAGATGYRVIIDGVMQDEVSSTSFVSDTLVNGMHMVAVAAVAGGEIKNITEFVTTTLNDEGVKPVTNFTVNEIKPSDGSNYPVVVSWTAPETTSEITEYRVYYSEYSYVSVAADQTSSEVLLPTWACEVNGEDGIEGVDLTMWVITKYKTGTSEKSNEMIVNPFNGTFEASVAEIESAEASIVAYPTPATDCLYLSAPAAVKLYNASGVLVLDAPMATSVNISSLVAGYYFLQGVDTEGNSFAQKVVIK